MKPQNLAIALFGLAAGSLCLPVPALAQGEASAVRRGADNPRSRIVLAEDWQFNFVGDDAEEIARPRDDKWERVSVPHTWNRVGYYLSDAETHINKPDTVEKGQGVGWYYLSFTAPAEGNGKRAFLEFDAASRTAEVWLNGHRLGEHRNPFARFRLDATDAIRFGEENSLYVKVDNTQPLEGASTEDVLPMTGDFFVRGGLYRPVSLILAEPVHFDLLDYGGPGVYASTRSITDDAARIDLLARVDNDAAAARQIAVSAQLLDGESRSVASWREETTIAGGASAELAGTFTVPDPRLWDGIADPYLYTLRFELRAPDGTLLDTIDQPFGIREMRLDPERGFILNGEPYPLVGVGLHQDTEQSDWAVSPEEVARTVQIIREMGANTIRLSHYQHGTPTHDLADQHGLILWDEIGLVTAWTNARHQTETPESIRANAELQLRELIRQNYNHASVAVWGIANEVDFGPGRPDFLGRPPEVIADPVPLLEDLYAIAKEEDPNRAVVLAQCCEGRGMSDVPVVAETVDAVGANRYYGWYYGSPEQLGPHLDSLRAKHPDKPLSVSEVGAGGAANMHTDNPLGGPISSSGRTQPEEFLSWFHEESWRQMKDRPYLWGVFLWNAFDFGTTVRSEGDSIDINTKGLVTYDRDIKKDAYFFYKANWSDAPTVHINGRRYVDRAYPVTDVRVYSNAPSTTITLNGQALGAMTDCPMQVCVWPDVRLSEGTNVVVAQGAFAAGVVEDRLEWRLDPAQANSFRIDSGNVVAAEAEVQFGSDDFFVGGTHGTTDQLGGRGRQPVYAEIAQTERRDVVASYRYGNFRYRIPMKDGRYRVTLSFVEPDKAIGERVFDVTANGHPVLTSYDIHSRAGNILTASVDSFEVTVENGLLDLHFDPQVGEAIVSSVEITPSG
jgi:beta-galactosidase